MNNNYSHEGGNILSAVTNLGMPLGLAVLANNMNAKNENKESKQDGGAFLSDSLLLEAGLAVVPFGLIALAEPKSEDNSDDSKSKTDNKKK